MLKKSGFTLIELLIVVAIIAILAAIAVPNFLEAQTRSKVSRCKADMRSIATGIEAYFVDNNRSPAAVTFSGNSLRVLWSANFIAGGGSVGHITTPIAYMTNIPGDPFNSFLATGQPNTLPGRVPFGYDKAGFGLEGSSQFPAGGPWTVRTGATGFVVQLPADFATGVGANGVVNGANQPRDETATPRRWVLYSIGPSNANNRRTGDTATSRYVVDYRYDPTNGTTSQGYILVYQGGPMLP